MAVLGGEIAVCIARSSDGLGVRLFESGSKLDTPLDAGSVHLEEGDAHQVDHNGRDDRECAFPQLFGLAPQVDNLGVELPDQCVGQWTWESGARTTAMKAAPMARATTKPEMVPAQICHRMRLMSLATRFADASSCSAEG